MEILTRIGSIAYDEPRGFLKNLPPESNYSYSNYIAYDEVLVPVL